MSTHDDKLKALDDGGAPAPALRGLDAATTVDAPRVADREAFGPVLARGVAYALLAALGLGAGMVLGLVVALYSGLIVFAC